MEYFWWVY